MVSGGRRIRECARKKHKKREEERKGHKKLSQKAIALFASSAFFVFLPFTAGVPAYCP
jgi:hypothetical protein